MKKEHFSFKGFDGVRGVLAVALSIHAFFHIRGESNFTQSDGRKNTRNKTLMPTGVPWNYTWI